MSLRFENTGGTSFYPDITGRSAIRWVPPRTVGTTAYMLQVQALKAIYRAQHGAFQHMHIKTAFSEPFPIMPFPSFLLLLPLLSSQGAYRRKRVPSVLYVLDRKPCVKPLLKGKAR